MSRTFTSLLISLALAGALVGAASHTATATDDSEVRAARGPGYHQPKAGSCHDLSLRQANAWSAPLRSSATDCGRRHTYITLVVKELRGQVDWQAPDIWRGVFGPCARKAQRVLGNNDKARAMSSYQLFSFVPTKKERARGAKWKVCGLGLLGGRTLQPLPKKLDLGRLPLDDAVARCYAGSGDGLRTTVCAKRHTWRATGAFRVSGKAYPGQRKLTRLAKRRCPELITGRWYRFEIPFNRDQWSVGYRTIVCLSKTRK